MADLQNNNFRFEIYENALAKSSRNTRSKNKEFLLQVSFSNLKFSLYSNRPVYKLNCTKMIKTIHNVPVNPELIWDYSFTDDEFQTETFLKWYLARVLNQGNGQDLRGISFTLIERYLPLLNISNTTRRFWERYFKEIRGRYS